MNVKWKETSDKEDTFNGVDRKSGKVHNGQEQEQT